MSQKITSLERVIRNLGSLFLAFALITTVVFAWAPGLDPQTAPGLGNVDLGTGYWGSNGANIYYNSGNVGIGTSSPTGKLHSVQFTDDKVGYFHAAKNNGGANYALYIRDDRGYAGVNSGDSLNIQSWATGDETGNLINVQSYNGTIFSRFVIKNQTGNVGIGKDDPTVKLEVEGDIKATGTVCDKNGCIGSGDGGISLWSQVEGSSDIYYSAGNVGIGTTSPTSKLNVFDDSTGSTLSVTTSSEPTYNNGSKIIIANNVDSMTGGRQYASLGLDYTNDYLYLDNNQSLLNHHFIINSAGNVGIGTTSPTSKLNVFDDSTGSTLSVTTSSEPTYNNGSKIIIANNVDSMTGGRQYASLGLDYTNDYLYLDNNQSLLNHHFIINSAGNVGIGKDDPTVKLEVEGDIKATGTVCDKNGCIGSGDGGISLWLQGDGNDVYYSDGNVGIGTTSPTSKLGVAGDMIIGTIDHSYLPSGTSWDYTLQLNGSNYTSIGFHDSGNSVGSIRYSENKFYIGYDDGWGAATTYFGGSVYSPGFFYASSDRRLKKNIELIPSALDKVLKLEGITFEWRDEARGEGTNLGLIAQDVEKVFPELVSTNEDTGLKSIQYSNLVAPLIEAVKEQQSQIEELKREIEKLKK